MTTIRNLKILTVFCASLCTSWTQAQQPQTYQGAAEPSTSQTIYGQGVRETPWRSPADELAGFHLPPGFVAELVASEPDIAKPINLAFDSRGRLWVTSTIEYPYPAAEGTLARDCVKIIEDTDGDGAFDSVKTFAEGLNIPMGVLPVEGGAIVFSIPNLWLLKDTDGDDLADEKVKLLGPFDTTRDTHGMINALRMGVDGWVYACHGFNNQSNVAAADGSRVLMNSGNTFRFRPDGSRVELHTRGQVNPFGMTSDEWGNWYTADCHSRPLTALLPGACYESFGRPHDGLGFAPSMMDHLHGSTAICGVEYYLGTHFPPAYRRLFYSGNVMTSRINCNAPVRSGMTVTARELPDFLTSEDPWFRPSDLRVGPDGCLYIADFYNKIIGHYEVPLEHPERDRTSGRIWRIRYVGEIDDPQTKPETPEASSLELVRELRIANGWTLPFDLEQQMRIERAERWLDHDEPEVVKAAVEFLGRFGSEHHGKTLLGMATTTDPADPVRLLALRIAIRNILQRDDSRVDEWLQPLLEGSTPSLSPAGRVLVEVLPGVTSPKAAEWMLRIISTYPDSFDPNFVTTAIDHAAKYPSPQFAELLAGAVEMATVNDPHQRASRVVQIADSLRASEGGIPTKIRELAERTQRELLSLLERRVLEEGPSTVWLDARGDSWDTEPRMRRDGLQVELLSSLTRGEQYTGVLKSEAFPCPAKLTFWIAGHNGFPDKPDHQRNRVQLIRVPSGQVLAEAFPPRNDTATQVAWNLSEFANQNVILQIVDGDSGNGFAWLGVARFSLPQLKIGSAGDFVDSLGELARRGLVAGTNVEERVSSLMSPRQRATLIAANLEGRGEHLAATLAHQALALGQSQWVTNDFDLRDAREIVEELSRITTAAQQTTFSRALLRSAGGCELLAHALEAGWLNPSSLRGAPTLLPDSLSPDRQQQLRAWFDAADASGLDTSIVSKRLNELDWSQTDLHRGHQVFKQHCANCHQLGGEGTTVGPQLDGAIQRGVERLAEDILLPNLNVDRAFRVTIFLLEDGSIAAGKVVDEDDRTIRLVGADGKPFAIPADEVDQRRESDQSLMPGNFAELLTKEQLADLLEFLSKPQKPFSQAPRQTSE